MLRAAFLAAALSLPPLLPLAAGPASAAGDWPGTPADPYDRYRSDLAAAHERLASGSAIARTPCGPIEYASVGHGPAVLLVHGAGGGFDQTLPYARALAAEGFRAVAMSRFGYLRTPLPADASPAAQADAHACLLASLGIARAAVVGVSAGAPSSLQFALRHPARAAALALLVPISYSPGRDIQVAAQAAAPPPFLFEAFAGSDFLFWLGMTFAPDFMARNVLATPPAVVRGASAREQQRFARMMALALPVSLRHDGLLNDMRIVSALAPVALERIAAPALLIGVADDLLATYESARYTASRIPGARFVGYRSGGHLWVGRDEAVMGEIKAFLAATVD